MSSACIPVSGPGRAQSVWPSRECELVNTGTCMDSVTPHSLTISPCLSAPRLGISGRPLLLKNPESPQDQAGAVPDSCLRPRGVKKEGRPYTSHCQGAEHRLEDDRVGRMIAWRDVAPYFTERLGNLLKVRLLVQARARI